MQIVKKNREALRKSVNKPRKYGQKSPYSMSTDGKFVPPTQEENNTHLIYGCPMFGVAKKKRWFKDKKAKCL